MNKKCTLFLIFFMAINIFATTNYVSKTGGHVSPFDSWANAATNIQAAVDAASAGDIALVNDGTYYPTNQISVTNYITVKSVNGAEMTVIDGNNKNRCFYLNNANTIDGFTITNGYASSGGGILCYGGGTVQNCTIISNAVEYFGGGICCFGGGTVQNCIISKNLTHYISGFGGGIFFGDDGIVQNCIIIENTAKIGGGVFCDNNGIVQNCTIYGNVAYLAGGGVYCNDNGGGTVQDSILWNNRNGNNFREGSTNHYNCIQNWNSLGNGIITNNPKFIDVASGNYRLEEFSPCRNAGTNMSWMLTATDLDGNPRITGGRVDMGAYEFIPEPGIIMTMSIIVISALRRVSWLRRH